jgi:uncharacterized membrane protein YphA (DoxX/SURF4 family)
MKKKILFVLSLLFGLLFINAGLNKIFNYMPMPEDMPENLKRLNGAFMEIGWLMPLVAVAEIVGGVLFIPRKTRALGALIIFPVMIAILIVHMISIPSGLPVALALMGVNIWVMVENRAKYLPMIH